LENHVEVWLSLFLDAAITAQTNFTDDGVELEGDFFSYCDNLLMKEMIYVID